jgi:hypothetical protein
MASCGMGEMGEWDEESAAGSMDIVRALCFDRWVAGAGKDSLGVPME